MTNKEKFKKQCEENKKKQNWRVAAKRISTNKITFFSVYGDNPDEALFNLHGDFLDCVTPKLFIGADGKYQWITEEEQNGEISFPSKDFEALKIVKWFKGMNDAEFEAQIRSEFGIF